MTLHTAIGRVTEKSQASHRRYFGLAVTQSEKGVNRMGLGCATDSMLRLPAEPFITDGAERGASVMLAVAGL